jgi:thiosulfate dehydrogenase
VTRRVLPVLITLTLAACSRSPAPAKPPSPLVAADSTMTTAWEIPRNPLTSPALGASPLADQVRRGFRIFTDTPKEAARFTRSRMTCANCHLNAGQRDLALPVVGIAGMFPEYNKRAGRLISLNDRIVDCFMRSENGAGADWDKAGGELPAPAAGEVLAVSAYLAWLSEGYTVGRSPAWRGRNTIAPATLIPLEKLSVAKGEDTYQQQCASCHGLDGQGVQIGDKKAGPLWGPDSWNDGAGAARVFTLAGMIRYAMPYLAPGTLSDEQAQELAAYITSKPRPAFVFKDRDYRVDPLPPDAVYYSRR